LKKDPSQPTLQVKGPPKSFFEADGADMEEDHRIPSEVLYMLRSVRLEQLHVSSSRDFLV
jgi:hypothetical protein